ncbi:MAG: sle [Conexibacter sp.]|nr:sle [Conexibacter sp.]
MSTFRLRRLRVIREDGDQAWAFSTGVTVFVGPVGVGKTSLLELIKYSLGGNGVLSQAVRNTTIRVAAMVELESGTFELSRTIGPDSQFVTIALGDERVRKLPIRARADRQTISDWLLDNAGIPRVRLSRTRSRRSASAKRYARVGFGDIYRYMYLDQSEIDRSTVLHSDKVLNNNRMRAFEVLYGLTGPEIAELEAEIHLLEEAAAKQRANTTVVEAFLDATDPGGSLAQAEAEARQVDGRVAAAEQQLAQLRRQARAASEAISGLREDLALHEHRLERARAQRAERFVQTDRLRLARAGVVADHARSLQAAAATDVFSTLSYEQCPRCLQLLSLDHGHERCVVCGQKEPELVTTQAIEAERSRLEQQIIETDDLIFQATQAADDLDLGIVELDRAAAHIRNLMDERAATAVTPFVEELSALSAEAARLHERRDAVRGRISRYEHLEALRTETARIAAEQDRKEALLAEAIRGREEARHRVGDLSANFTDILERIDPPWYENSRIDDRTYLPAVNGGPLEGNSAGVKTMINDAYYLANLTTALQQPAAVLLPGFLIIDSPQKNFGSNKADRDSGRRVYSRIDVLRAEYGENVQIIIADNDLPTEFRKNFRVVKLSYEKPLLEAVAHPGEGKVETVTEAIEASRPRRVARRA